MIPTHANDAGKPAVPPDWRHVMGNDDTELGKAHFWTFLVGLVVPRMRRTEWDINEPKPHVVSLQHGYWWSKTTIWVDNQEILRRPGKFWDFGLEHRFDIDGVPCIVRIILRFYCYTYELWVDGKLK